MNRALAVLAVLWVVLSATAVVLVETQRRNVDDLARQAAEIDERVRALDERSADQDLLLQQVYRLIEERRADSGREELIERVSTLEARLAELSRRLEALER